MARSRPSQSGNMLIYLLGAILLIGVLMVILRGSFQEGSGIENDKLTLKVNEVQRYASEIQRAVNYVMQNGYSETDIRFARPDVVGNYGDIASIPQRQVFSDQGGGAEYKLPPSGVNDATPWQFYATTHITDAGTDTAASSKAELIAVLPNVTQAFCSRVNMALGQTVDLGVDNDPAANGCINAGTGNEFNGTYRFGATNNTLTGTFTKMPALEMCVRCTGPTYNYYKVLLVR